MRLYRFLRYFIRLLVRLYFLRVDSSNKEAVPPSGPVILAANHPSSILDSVLLATELTRPVNYLAKSELFRSPVLARIYTWLGAIPIRRGKGETAKREAFEQVYLRLEEGKCVGIFPEGRNSPHLQLANLRSGTARMALEVEARNNYQLGLQVVPVGINFQNRELFMSSVLLRFGEAVQVADFVQLHRKDPEEAILQLTRHLEQKLRQQANHLEDLRLGQLIEDLGGVYQQAVANRHQPSNTATPSGHWGRIWHWLIGWFRPSPVELDNLQELFEGRSQLNQALSRASLLEPELVDELNRQVIRYKDHLRQLNLRDDLDQNFAQPLKERLLRLRMTLYALGMAPFAAYGVLHNLWPWLIARFFGKRFHDEALRTFAYFGVGLAAFIGTYLIFGFWLWRFTDRNLTGSLIYLATLPPTGLIALHYRTRITQYRHKILVRTFLLKRESLMNKLEDERQKIVRLLEKLHERYGDPQGF
ncbi:1-acyl-sn-glycerol-3-phosphate acyltransferases [Marinospirillum celere]|uniref:1-acyl-sn-glycerol-3-phosphate acyltransferases n=1 Tax=Marinospirillum celere TaxID=1122252 RepID=A0A1I1DXF8_9GAMM|nr:1-acyl-sn-glycerol-3-phosphate acyltransferase [Marinospirillum celere]SFB77708.1 1-acyl-sn-glycerol-3-phosphate acyltransferases [Marinospirillum celere]